MNRNGPIMMVVALLLGAGITLLLPGVSVRSAAAADEPQASAHGSTGRGLVRTVDADTNTLVLETRSGTQRIHVAPAATIRDDHADTLTLGEIAPGDAVAYEVTAGAATALHVAREFWAVPSQVNAPDGGRSSWCGLGASLKPAGSPGSLDNSLPGPRR